MVSMDEPDKNKAFAESLNADQVLLSDPSGLMAAAFGVKGFAGLYAKRWTFYIDRDGIIREIDKTVNTGTAGQDIARKLGELGFPKRSGDSPG